MKNKLTSWRYEGSLKHRGGYFAPFKSVGSWAEGSMTSGGASIEHPLSIHSASIQHPLQIGVWKVALCILIALFVGISNVWGANKTYELANPTSSTYGYSSGPIRIYGNVVAAKCGSSSNVQCFQMTADYPLVIASNCANIKSIAFDACSSSSGSSGTSNDISVYYHDGKKFALLSSGFTATQDGNSLTSLDNIPLPRVQTNKTTISVSFSTNQYMIAIVRKGQSPKAINISVTYDDAITPPTEFVTVTATSPDANSFSISPASTGSMDGSTTGSSKSATYDTKYYTQINSTNTYTMPSGESLSAGDWVLFDIAPSQATKNLGVIVQNGEGWDSVYTTKNYAAKGQGLGYILPYKIQTTSNTLVFKRNNSENYIHGFTIYHASAPATTYTVTYKAGTGATGDDVVDDDASTVADCPNTISKSGYRFVGWNTATDGSGDPYAVGDAVSEDLTLYAQWAQEYSVSYANTGAASGDAPTNATKYIASETFKVAGAGTMVAAANKTFGGWNDGSATYQENDDYTVTSANVSFTPVWKNLYTVTYAGGEATEGSVTDSNSPYVEGANVTVLANGFTAPSGKQFKNWLCSNTNEYDPDDVINSISGNLTFTAQWEALAYKTITLDPNGGTISDATGWTLNAGKYTKEVAQNTEVALPTFTKAGRVFMTWREGAVAKTSPVTVSDDIELKAIWGTEEEVEIYYWEGKSGGATERGGTAISVDKDGNATTGNEDVNYPNSTYYTFRVQGKSDYSNPYIKITTDEAVKTGDKITFTGYINKNQEKDAALLMKAGDKVLFAETTSLPNIAYPAETPESPVEREYTITTTGVDATVLDLMRNAGHTGTNCFVTKLAITGTRVVEDMEPAATPTISVQPTGGTYAWNADATQSVTASVTDGGTLSYQWYKKGTTDDKVGTNSASYAPTVSGTYYVIVTNTKTGYAKTTTKSNEVVVTINPRPSYKVSYYDGAVKLGEETVYDGESPTHAGDFDDLPMATFQGWFNNADLAPEHAVATIGEEVITEATNYYSKWNKTYASSVDFVQFIADNTTSGDYTTYLSTNGYLLTEGTGNANALDNSNAFDTGLKLKSSNDNKLQFNVTAGKIIKLTVGKINGMSIAINGAAATAVPGGTNKDNLGVSYYYSANPQAVTIAETSTNYNMLKVIEFLDPMTVTYDATTNGGSCETASATFTGTALTLPEATKSGWQFDGWFTTANDDSETGVLVGEAGETYTPSANITLFARFTETTTLATLTDIKVNGTTVAGFAVDKFEYNVVLPYKTADVPTVAYTKGYSGATVTMSPDPITAVFGDVTLHVVSQDASNSNDYVIHITEGPKDMLCLIKLTTPNGTGNDQTVAAANISGYIGGTATQKLQSGGTKLGSKGNYIELTIAEGTFQAGDIVRLEAEGNTLGDYVRVFKANSCSEENELVKGTEAMNYGMNEVTLPANTLSTLYLRRGTDGENYNTGWNPWVKSFGVYRPFPTPELAAITIDGATGSISGTAVSVTVPKNADLANLTIVPTFLSNDPANTSGARQGGNTWVEGENTYRVTDKDGDYTDYTITLAKDVAIESVTISGETSVMAKSQITLTATVLPAAAANKNVTWTSSDETKATVDANGVVTGKAAGNVTITATSVADGTISDTHDITVTKFVGTEYAYWFAKAADATTNGVTNDDGTIFEGAPTDGSNLSASLTMEVNGVEQTYTVTRRSGDDGFGTFHVPADFTANLYMLVAGSGSPRTLTLKETSTDAEYASTPATFGSEATKIVFENIPSGNYSFDKHSQGIRLAVMVAELNSYPLTSVSLEDGFNLRISTSRTPEMTLNPTKAAIASQTWTEVSRTGASDATFSTSTGAITAGTEEGTITVKVSVTDVFGNTRESGNCVVNIVNIIDQQPVTGSVTWNWNGAAAANVAVDQNISLVLANYISGDEWAKIKGSHGDWAYNTNANGSYQGVGSLSFTTTVPGLVTVTGRRISDDAELTVAGYTFENKLTSSLQTFGPIAVKAGEINITPDSKGMRITKVEFSTDLDPEQAEESLLSGYERTTTQGRLGTICLPNGGVMVGADLFEIAYYGQTSEKIFFDQIVSGEMVAGTPYIFLPKEGATQLGVYYTDAANAAAGNHNGLYGYIDTDLTDDVDYFQIPDGVGNYIVQNNQYREVVAGANAIIRSNRAYIHLADITPVAPALTPGRIRMSIGPAHTTPTGVEEVTGDGLQVTGVQKVMIDGTMYILRGEKMYDATGRLVK